MRFSDEKNIITNIPKHIYAKCLKKKKKLFVSSLSEAINDVDTNEKNKPIIKKEKIIKKN